MLPLSSRQREVYLVPRGISLITQHPDPASYINILLDEVLDIVEVAGLDYAAVVVAVRELFPHDSLGLAQPE
jgi:hypothetical protein